MDVPGGVVQPNATSMEIWDCYGGDSQRFGYDQATGAFVYLTTSIHCLTYTGDFKGAPIVLEACDGCVSRASNPGYGIQLL